MRKSDVWVASLDGGISHITRNKTGYSIKNYRYLTALPSNRIHALALFKNDIWFGTESKGVGFIRGGKVTLEITESQLNFQNVRAIRANSNGIWIATSGGLYRYNPETKILIEPSQGVLKSNNLYLLEFDQIGHLYLGHERGLEKLTINETGDVIEIEFFGFCLLLLSAILIGIWAYRGGHKGILLLQFFYATAGIIGMIRWF